MGPGTDPYQALLDYPQVRVIGFEPDERQCAARSAAWGPTHQFFPYVVGTGERRIFHECANPLTSSIYPPNQRLLELFLGMDLPVVARREVETHRLDDVEAITDVDFLKIDVQGAERDVLRGASRLLKQALVIHTEVEFVPLYEGQPLFGDVDVELRRHDFMLHKFVGMARGTSALLWPAVYDRDARFHGNQLLFAEAAVYVRDLARLADLPSHKLLALAAIAHDVYGSFDIACLALAEHDRRSAANVLPRYLTELRSALPADSTGSEG